MSNAPAAMLPARDGETVASGAVGAVSASAHPSRHDSAREELRRRSALHGKGRCRWCGGKLPKARRSWCSDECVGDYMIRANAATAAARVFERDRGVCALCGRDCERLRAAVERVTRREYQDAPRSTLFYRLSRAYRSQLVMAGFSTGQRLWHMDHIVPVAEGGGSCGLDNLRTLCQPCHKRETAMLARRLADRRRGQLALTDPPA